MSLFNFFGTKKKDETPSPQKVIQNMRGTLETLEKREQFLEKRINDFKTEARTIVKTNKQKALMLLKKAKMSEKQLLSIYGQKENIEIQICALEQGISNQNIISSLKQGKNAIEKFSANLDPDDIGELMYDIGEGISKTDEISTAISAPIGPVYDEDDLLTELAEFNVTEEKKDVIDSPINLPSVPETNIINKKVLTSEEKELKELEELMTM